MEAYRLTHVTLALERWRHDDQKFKVINYTASSTGYTRKEWWNVDQLQHYAGNHTCWEFINSIFMPWREDRGSHTPSLPTAHSCCLVLQCLPSLTRVVCTCTNTYTQKSWGTQRKRDRDRNRDRQTDRNNQHKLLTEKQVYWSLVLYSINTSLRSAL